jgi:hypothetical protein
VTTAEYIVTIYLAIGVLTSFLAQVPKFETREVSVGLFAIASVIAFVITVLGWPKVLVNRL